MTAIEILRAASRSVPNEDYVQFMAAVDAVEEVIKSGRAYHDSMCPTTSLVDRCNAGRRFEAAIANVSGAA